MSQRFTVFFKLTGESVGSITVFASDHAAAWAAALDEFGSRTISVVRTADDDSAPMSAD